jgi:hypothetical protein
MRCILKPASGAPAWSSWVWQRKIGEWFPALAVLRYDAVAALGVSAVVVWVSLQLGRRTVEALLGGAARSR